MSVDIFTVLISASWDREKHLTRINDLFGPWERMFSVMEFQEALCALVEEPEACYDFFGAIADHKIRLYEYIIRYYQPDILCMHDDYGHGKGMFMSPETWRALIKPHLQRIIDMHISPVNISVHTTNPELRCRMLHNRFAGEALDKIRRFYEAGIEMNGQIVLCKGINDGQELERTIGDLAEYLPYMESVSVVPVGLTKYRKGLYPLESFEKADALKVLELVEKWQKICFDRHGKHFIHASDEWYLLAERPFPAEEVYDGYVQLENGVGMMPLLQSEFEEALREEQEELRRQEKNEGFFRRARKYRKQAKEEPKKKRVLSIATGRLAAPLLRKLAAEFLCYHSDTEIYVYEIRNDFFGEKITVSGLLTGRDLKKQLKGQPLGEKLLLPCNLLRSGEEVFLDDMTPAELEKALQVPIHIVKSDGKSLLEALKD